MRFKKDDILTALHLAHSSHSNDTQLFKKSVINQLPRVLDWYLNGDKSKYADEFKDMSIKEFQIYQKEKVRKLAQDSVVDRKGKKRARDEDSDDERPVKKGKDKASRKERYQSDDLDGSSD